ncbi:class I SAM-dependent methyltransferase [Halobellus rarus]|uniref:SAM-dependent methyltransferase n=1 Tax=Halobellus rarus TaxID=1126237 RepID=A0ABD6CQF7_9EURY|nr:class I SAM-dependent methyltransferase [Halobellus rarus]
MNHARPRYLESKRSVDDRALSRRVRERLLADLPPDPRIVEAGCGTGVTVSRLLSWGIASGRYLGVDTDERIVDFARDVRPKALRRRGYAVTDRTGQIDRCDPIEPTDQTASPDPEFTVADLDVGFATGDALDTLEAASDCDLVVAQAFADLVPLSRFVSAVESALRPGGLAYVPITFDGGTIFQPDHPADDAVEGAYHAAIDARPGRDVRAGRHLIDLLGRRAGTLLEAESSDWIVRARGRRYPADERYFLSRILGFVDEAVGSSSHSVDAFDSWLSTRREQLGRGSLTYVAHQYDLLYRAPKS